MELKGRVNLETNKAAGDMAKLGKSTKQLEADLKKAGKAAKSSGGDFNQLGTSTGSMLRSLAGPAMAFASVGAVISLGRASVELAQEQMRVEKQLETVIRSTGGAAGVTADEVKRMASAFQQTTNFGDEATISGQNLLLTFTNIGQDVFPDTTRTMLDMSAALGQDLKSSALQLGKALNDPIKGVSALKEVGVSFTETQMAMVRSMQEAGNIAGAQTLILDELNREFGGSAEAAREADAGVQAAKNAMGDLGEVVGTLLLPSLKNTSEWLVGAAEGVTSRVEVWNDIAAMMRTIRADEMGMSSGEATEENIARYKELEETAYYASAAVGDLQLQLNALKSAAESGTTEFDEQIAALEAEIASQSSLTDATATLRGELDAAADSLAADQVMLQNYRIATEMATAASTAFALAMMDELVAIDKLYASQTNLELMRGGLGSNSNVATASGQFGTDQYATGTQSKVDTTAEKSAEETGKKIAESIATGISSNLSSAVSSVLGEGFNVLDGLGLDLGGGDDAGRDIAENARRLAIVASKGYVDQMDSSIQALGAERPDLMNQLLTSENPGELARQILSDFQTGVDSYGLIDEEKAKERINNMLFAGEKRKEMIDRITQDILSEGQYSADQVQQAVGQELGAGTAQVAGALPEEQLAQVEAIAGEIERIGTSAEIAAGLMVESFDSTLEPLENLQLALEEIVKIVERVEVVAGGATGAVTGLGNSVGLEPVGAGSGNTPGFAAGGSMIVGGSGGPDSQLLRARVSPGERVDFTPAGGTPPGGGPTVVMLYLDGQQIAQVVGGRQAASAEQLARMGGHAYL